MIFNGKKILIADDTEMNRVVGKIMLEAWGCDVEVAENGRKAVEIIEKQPESIDVIIMDNRMPVMDGIEATSIIRNKLNWDKPIIGFIGDTKTETIDECINCGMNSWIPKPFEKSVLENILRKQLYIFDEIDVDNKLKEIEKLNTSRQQQVKSFNVDITYSTHYLLEILGGSKESLRKILTVFVRESEYRNTSMKKAFDNNDWSLLCFEALSTKTNFRYFEIEKSFIDCKTLEDLAREQIYSEKMIPLINKIITTRTKLTTQLKEDFNINEMEEKVHNSNLPKNEKASFFDKFRIVISNLLKNQK